LYSKTKLIIIMLVFGLTAVMAISCSSPNGNVFTGDDREGAAVTGDRGVIATEDVKLAEIENLRLKDRVISTELSIKFADGVSENDKNSILKNFGLTVIDEIQLLGYHRVSLKSGLSLNTTLKALWQKKEIKVAEPIFRNYAKQVRVMPNDPMFQDQSYLEQINAPEAWFVEPGSDLGAIPEESDVVVAILDTGLDIQHPDIMIAVGQADGMKILDGWNYVDGNMNVDDEHGHGTLVTGIIGALTSNTIGIAGIAWNPRILPVKVLDNDGRGDSFRSAQGIMFALGRFNDLRNKDQGSYPPTTIFTEPFNAQLVINMSYGYRVSNSIGESQTEASAIQACYENQHVMLVAAAGDDGTPIDNGVESIYPVNNIHCVKVGAVDYSNILLPTSNTPSLGQSLEIQRFVVAPGYNILSTFPTDFSEGYAVGMGTSFAAAQVSGLIALIWEQFPYLRPVEVVEILKDSSNCDIVGTAGIDDTTGWGLIDCLAALTRSFNPTPINDPIIVRAFTNPILHGDIIFVVRSRYALMDPIETPWYLDPDGLPVLINDGKAVSYNIGYDTDDDGVIDTPVPIVETFNGQPTYFPNELMVGQFSDDLYVGRLHFNQDTPPDEGTLIFQFTGVPMNWRDSDAIPRTVSGEDKIEVTGFHHS